MDEVAALEISAVRALELRDPAKVVWTEADRAWASRAAAEVVGEQADSATFLARRARLALERIGEHAKALPRAARTLRWRPWVAWTIIGGAFVLGVIVDRIGGAQRINLLAPPVFALLLWNLLVYAVLVGGLVIHYGEDTNPGPLRRLVMSLASRTGVGRRWSGSVHGDAREIIGASLGSPDR